MGGGGCKKQTWWPIPKTHAPSIVSIQVLPMVTELCYAIGNILPLDGYSSVWWKNQVSCLAAIPRSATLLPACLVPANVAMGTVATYCEVNRPSLSVISQSEFTWGYYWFAYIFFLFDFSFLFSDICLLLLPVSVMSMRRVTVVFLVGDVFSVLCSKRYITSFSEMCSVIKAVLYLLSQL